MSTFQTTELVILRFSFFFLLKTDKYLCPLPNPWVYFAIPGLKVFVFMRDNSPLGLRRTGHIFLG